MEDGVEVILNHLEPYQIKGGSGILNLEKLFSIDTENEDWVKEGLEDIETFDIDEEENIFIIQWNCQGNYLFKFDRDGNFLKSFLHFGQGPGEIEWGGSVIINPQGEVMAKDPSKRKFLVYDREGNFLRETKLEKHFSLSPLQNGNYFISWQDNTPDLENIVNHIGLCNSQFNGVKELDTSQYPNLVNPNTTRVPVNRDKLIFGKTKENIFIGNSQRDYEIREYDLDGNLLRKVKKEYNAVRVSDEYKNSYFSRFAEGYPWRKRFYFKENWPPFQDMFTDDEGRIFVMTYEEDTNSGESQFDIFNTDRVFIGRVGLRNKGQINRPFTTKAAKRRLYSLESKENGYKELVVYRMIWE